MYFHRTCHFQAPDFWSRFEAIVADGGVFYFWGHSYELLTEAQWAAFDAQVAALARQPQVRWTTVTDLFREPDGSAAA
jgi:hypothetical protein